MITGKILKGALSAASILYAINATQAVTIDPTSYCLTCKEGCAGAVKKQCKKMCKDMKEHIASLQMSKLANATGKKFRTSRDKAEKADMLYDSPLYKCLGVARVSTAKPPAEKNTACLAVLQNVEDALNATIEEFQSAKKTLMTEQDSPASPASPPDHSKKRSPIRHH